MFGNQKSERRGAPDRGQHRQAAGAVAALIKPCRWPQYAKGFKRFAKASSAVQERTEIGTINTMAQRDTSGFHRRLLLDDPHPANSKGFCKRGAYSMSARLP